MRSLKARLGAGIIVALILGFGLQWLLVSVAIRSVTEDYVVRGMEQDIDSLLAALRFDTAGVPSLSRSPGERYEGNPYSGRYYQVWAAGRTLRSRSLWDQVLPERAVKPGESALERMAGPLRQPLFVLRRGFLKEGNEVVIAVAEDMSAIRTGIRRLQWLYLAVSGTVLILLLLSQRWILDRSLAPLTSTRIDLDLVSRGEAEQLNEDVPDEVRPLVREINELLRLLGRRLQRGRGLAASLAHSLKTPLSLIMQIASDPALESHPELRERLRDQAGLIQERIERELNRARLAGEGRGSRRFRPDQDLPPLVETLRRIHADRDLEIEVLGMTDAPWPADREDMMELLGNLADNACKWARRRVRITLGPGPGVRIEDDGPGIPDAVMRQVGRRGTRLDESVPGHGLGLSIVRDIVEHYHGELVLGRAAELGGMSAEARLGSEGCS